MRRVLLSLLLAPSLLAEGPEFEAAAIKPSVISNNMMVLTAPRGGPGTADPTHITMNFVTLKQILMFAFDVKRYQISGPDTLDSEHFDFAVVVPEGATKEQVPIMWRNLLADRFKLKWHIEQKEFQVDEIVVGPRGHKLKENNEPEPPPPDPNAPPRPIELPKLDKDGRPQLDRPGLMIFLNNGPNGLSAKGSARAQPLSALANVLSNQLEHPVVDKTGLTGKYDFELEYAPSINGALLQLLPPQGPRAADGAPQLSLELSDAIQQQLGLRLVKSKDKLDVIVVDSIERTPTEN